MVEAATMNPNQVEVPFGQFVKINMLMWNYRGALNPNFKRRVFEMAVNHHPSIMVITKTRVGGDRAERIIEGLPFRRLCHHRYHWICRWFVDSSEKGGCGSHFLINYRAGSSCYRKCMCLEPFLVIFRNIC